MKLARYGLLLVAFTALGSALPARADTCAGRDPCPPSPAWATAFDTFDIRVPGTKPGDYAHWRIKSSPTTHDTTIAVDQAEAGRRTRGTLAMVGGRVLIANGVPLKPGFEIGAVDGPFLYALLTTQLLARAYPAGPDALQGTQRIEVREPREGLRVGTPLVSADFGAPWTVTGTARRDPSGTVHFDLNFTSSMPAGAKPPQFTVRLTGTLEHAAADPALPDAMSLQGWSVHGVGPVAAKEGGATAVDGGAVAGNKGYRTVGDVRRALAGAASPGAADATRDFTGFWKEACDQDFGLQIAPVPPAGMYAVTFCGPGACADPDTYRPHTFVAGDPGYEVVTQDEIRVRGPGGWSTYRKCSPDPQATPKR